jgi:methionyl-tRNA formyltransferase
LTAKIIFMGTPDFAVPSLKALIDASTQQGWEIVAVVTQPDRPKGRGKQLAPPPVKVEAEAAGIHVLQPRALKSEEAVAGLAALNPDVIVVAAFGQILRKNVLDLPPFGCLNIHASLLPRWRGASPVTAAIRAGDTETGITIMRMDVGLDTGPIISQQSVTITPEHTGGSLTEKLAEVGGALLVETLPKWLSGQIKARPQDDSLATKTRLLKKQDGAIDWTQPAVEIERQVRAFLPWPGTFTFGPRGQIKILKVSLADETVSESNQNEPGTVFRHGKKIYVAAGKGAVRLIDVQPAGKKAMAAEALLNGQPDLLGAKLG